MSTEISNIYTWMNEIVAKKPEALAEFFYSDIMDYVFPENFDDIEELADEDFISANMRAKLLSCPTKEAVKVWMNKITSVIVMKMDTEEIIADYLG